MPETPLNPFRNTPKDLNPKEDPFFQDFVPGYQPQEADQPEQEQPPVPTNTEQGLTASKEEVEAYDNTLVKCAGIEITRKEKTQIEEIVKKLNEIREKEDLHKVELGKEVNLYKVAIGGVIKEELLRTLKIENIKISVDAQMAMQNSDFIVQENKEEIILVKLSASDLGFPWGANYKEIKERVILLGMESCPTEAGPQFRLRYKDQPADELMHLCAEKITDSPGGIPYVFSLYNGRDGAWLTGQWSPTTYTWSPDDTFVFRIPTSVHES